MREKLQSVEQYLMETEPAIRNLFENLKPYYAILKKIKWPAFGSLNTSEEACEAGFKKWQRKNRATYKRASERLREYLGYRISIGTLCGSILQIAYMGIVLFSKNRVVPPEFSSVIKAGSKDARFCIGRRAREVPIGLIIYAGRNQYNHMDERNLKLLNTFIFDILATNHGIKRAQKIKDPAFDLCNKTIEIYSANVLSILGWDSYDGYIADMKGLLTP